MQQPQQDTVSFFKSIGIDLKQGWTSGTHYGQCPKCHGDRKKRGTKELLINLDTGWVKCYHCGWEDHINASEHRTEGQPTYTPPPPKPQKFITPEPIFNWSIPDAVIDPAPTGQKQLMGKYSITWYYRNANDKLTGAKRMEYNFHESGFNRTEAMPVHLYTRDSGYYPCLFYERDLYNFPHATVLLVESEKTAAILRKQNKNHLKDFIFIATGGSNGLTAEKVKVLAGRKVLIVYDCDNSGREGAQSAMNKLAAIANAEIVDIAPDRTDGYDLADGEPDIEFIKNMRGNHKFPIELTDRIKELNRTGERWNKEQATKIAETFLIDLKKVYEIGRIYYETNKHEFGIDSATLVKRVEYFLNQKFEFRRNILNKRIFYRERNINGSEFVFCNFNDVWRLLQHNLKDIGAKPKDFRLSDVSSLLESSFVPDFNPFSEYFHSLPHWDGVDHIANLANHITTTDQNFWISQFRKCLIRMIACTYAGIENRIIMVLVQPAQEKGKDSFIRFLCPPQLKEYYKEDPMTINKDSEIALTQNFIWNLTELDQLTKKGIAEIKGIISRAYVKQRRAYGRQEENMQRVVNFWGTTNKEEFLTDTQNTRWLCFRITHIDHDYNNFLTGTKNIDIQKVWSQAWYLYKSGEAFMLSEEERDKRDIINHSFEIMPPEKQLIIKFLTPCSKDTPNVEFVTVTEVLEYLIKQTDNKLRLAPENVGRSMTQLDFEPGFKKTNGKNVRGYYCLKMPLINGAYIHQPAQEPQPNLFQSVPGVDEDMPF